MASSKVSSAANAARAVLAEVVKQVADTLGFQCHAAFAFQRTANGRLDMISFHVRELPGGHLAATCVLGIRFDLVERILGRADTNAPVPTVITPLHYLSTPATYREWQVDPDNVATLRDEMIESIQNKAIPFFESCADIGLACRQLEDPVSCKRFALDSQQRIVVLAAMKVALGQRGRGLELLRDALHALEGAPLKKRLDIEMFLRRVETGAMTP